VLADLGRGNRTHRAARRTAVISRTLWIPHHPKLLQAHGAGVARRKSGFGGSTAMAIRSCDGGEAWALLDATNCCFILAMCRTIAAKLKGPRARQRDEQKSRAGTWARGNGGIEFFCAPQVGRFAMVLAMLIRRRKTLVGETFSQHLVAWKDHHRRTGLISALQKCSPS